MKKKLRSAFLLESLEARLLFSADLAPVPVDGGNAGAENGSDLEISLRPDSGGVQATDTDKQERREVIFVDEAVDDVDRLIADLESQRTNGRQLDIVALDSDRDGIAQISEYLSRQQDVAAVHFISHGTDGEVVLGNNRLNKTTLDGYAEAIEGWQRALSSDADLLLYGCNLAAGDEGQDLVNSLTLLTGADVAASDDVTGSAQLGGDWVLEYGQGEIESAVAINPETQQNWSGVLATYNVTTTTDDVPGSLRQAILDANDSAEADVISLPSGTYLLSPGLGELEITSEITITGADAGTTIIDGGAADRVLQLKNGANLTLTDLTVQGGRSSNDGGGIYVNDSNAQLTATRVIVTGNIADGHDGAGIYNKGTMTLTDVVISNNGDVVDRTHKGGGIYSDKTADLNRVTISGNRADDGGGIFNDGTMTLTDVVISNNGDDTTHEGGGIHNKNEAILNGVTISGNRADKGGPGGGDGGGIHNDNTATSLFLTNVTVSGNSADDKGGGLHTESPVTIVNSTFTLNSADRGGGISHTSDPISIKNTIVAENLASSDPDVEGTFTSQGFNLIGDKGTVTNFTSAGDQTGTAGSPINPLLGSLKDNGGFTHTHLPLGGSPAVDAGTLTGPPAVDQRGIPRPLDGDGDATAAVDIGAVEVVPDRLVHAADLGNPQVTSAETRGSHQAVAMAVNGNSVVVWSSLNEDGSGWGVFGQRFDASGTPVGSKFQVNDTLTDTDNEYWATVAMDAAGNFVVVWTADNQDGTTKSVYGRGFNSDGTEAFAEFKVNTYDIFATDVQKNPSVAMTSDGRFVIAWEGAGSGVIHGILFRRFNADGSARDAADRIANAFDRGTETTPAVAINDSGDFAIVWEVGSDIYVRPFSDDGSPVRMEVQVNAPSISSVPDVAIDATGRITVVWRSVNGVSDGVWMQCYASNGLPGIKLQVDQNPSEDSINPSIAMDSAGNTIVVFEGSGDGDGLGVFGRKYDAGGTPLTDQFQINQTATGTQHMASVAMLDTDNFVVVWSGNGADDASGVYLRQFGAINDAPALADDNPTLTAIDEDDVTSAGDSVAAIVVDGSITDADGAAVESIAITAVDDTNGTWQYYNGVSWNDVDDSSLAVDHALLLDGTQKLRFVPTAHYNGTATFTFRAWDQSTGSAGTYADTTSSGGTTAFSSATDTAAITINAINDAPVLADDNPTLTAIDEDNLTSAGDSVAAIVVNGSITDPDGAAVESIAITAVDDTNGTWQYSTDNGVSWSDVDDTSLAVDHALLLDGTLGGASTQKLRFAPNANYNGTATFTFRAWDQSTGSAGTYADTTNSGGTFAFSSATDTAAITINAINDAPVLADDNPTLTAIDEDNLTSAGDSVAAIVVNGSITDPDGAAVESIAITAVDDTNGTWQYSTDNGVSWSDVDDTSLAVDHALLLDGTLGGASTQKLRFVPNANYNGTATFTFRAWDQSTGSAGTYADTTNSGGTFAFSSATDTAAITINAINDAPVLADDNPTLTAIDEDNLTSAGDSVAAIVVNGSITDPDGAAVESIAITAVDDTNGTWQYSTDNGVSWSDVDDTSLAVDHALLLDGTLGGASTQKLRFAPNANYNGTATFTFRAWDQSTGSAGTYADTTNSGGTFAFSSATDTAAITINAINDAPVLADDNPTLTAIDEDNLTSAGDSVAAIVVNGSITDPDGAAVESIAITAVDDTNGTWQYSTDNGVSWSDVDDTSLAVDHALLLDGTLGGASTQKLRFVPNANYNGTATFTFRAWDQSTGSAGTYADTTNSGGTFAFSSATDTAAITINAINDAPVLADDNPTLTAIDEDNLTSAGDSVAAIVVNGSITDPDGAAVESIAITAVDDTNGTWQYSTDNGVSWSDVDDTSLAVDHALLLDGTLGGASTQKLRFVPNANYNGTATFTFRAWDQSTGSAGTYADTTNSGGTFAFSSATDTAAITINAINDAPVLADDNPTLTAIDEDNLTSAGDSVAAIVVNGSITDPDGAAVESIAITAVDDTNGTWQYSTDNGVSWSDVDDTSLAVDHALLLDGTLGGASTQKLRFVPNANYNGTATFTFRAWDQSTGSAGTYADTTNSGGTFAFSSATDTAAITINAINDAPVLADDNPTLTAIDEDNLTSAGDSVAAIVVNGSITDPDGAAVESIAITAVDDTNGTWQYSTDNGVSWSDVDDTSLAVDHALLLDGTLGGASTQKLRFVPNANYNGTATFTFRAWDQSTGSADTYADTTSSGGTTAFSTATDTAAITINALNDAPLGLPTISGTVTEDQTLSAVTSGISDVDGLGAFSYQWLRNGAVIVGATGSSYTLDDADVGQQISVEVSYTDGQGTLETVPSAQVGPVANVNDAPVGVPVITGTVTEDQTLTADTTGISDVDGLGAFSYQWLRNGAAIVGATGSSYTLDDADVGQQISVEVSYTDGQGTLETVPSAQVGPVANVNDAPVGVPVITGTVTEDQTLSAVTSGISDVDGLGAFSYQWLRNGAVIVGATGSSYTLDDADVGQQISVEVSYTDGQGTLETVPSAQVGPVANVNDAPVGVPVITGTVTEDQTLSAVTSGISDVDGLGAFSYQWLRNGAVIVGATGSSYTLDDADVGQQISVEVSYTDGQGTLETVPSAQVGPVANVNDAPVGVPVITGTVTEDQTLSAVTSGISDVDGLGAFSYQWLRNGAVIVGATGSSYTLDDADVGQQISVEVSYTDGQGTLETVPSAQVGPVANVNDAPVGVPVITGTVTEDQTLSAVTSGISDVDGLGAFSYQWLRNGAVIVGATGSSYTLDDADVGQQISVEVSYTDGQGTLETVPSAQVGPVANVNDAPVGVPVITGTVTEDQTLTADTTGISDVDGLGAFSYQWLRNGAAIVGATGSSYTLDDADVGQQISVEVSYTDGQGTLETVPSAQVGPVANVNDAPVGVPVITGTVTEDQTLSAVTSGISDVDGLGAFSYQWLRNGAAIVGATGSSYTLDDADVGQQISVEVNYSDGHGTAEGPLTSLPTAAVTNVNDAGNVTIDNTTPTQGDTLTAGVTDADGASGAISFQWFSDWVAVGGATGKTYTTTQADVGTIITVTAVYTDDQDTAESLSSAPTAAVTNVNETPVAVNDNLNATEDQSMAFTSITDFLGNDTDIDGDALTLSGFTQPANGMLVDNGDGTLTYTPAGNFNGNDSFTYTISDGKGETATGTAIIAVAPVGDTPQVTSASAFAEDLSGLIFVNRNASDGAEVTHFKISGITNGTLYLADGVTRIDNGDFITVEQGQAGLKFTPAKDSTADGSFNVESSENGVSVASQSGIATSIITVMTPASLASEPEQSPPKSDPEQVVIEEIVEEEEESEDVEDVTDETDVQADADNMLSVETPQPSKVSGTSKRSFNPGIAFLGRGDLDSDDDKTPDHSTRLSPQTLKMLIETENIGELKAALKKLGISTLSPEDYELVRSSLDAIKDEMGKEILLGKTVLGSAIATSVGLSAGYVVWMLKGGSLLASLLSSLPAWQLADPLAILVGKKEDEDDDDDSLKTIIEEGSGRDEDKESKASKFDKLRKKSTKQ